MFLAISVIIIWIYYTIFSISYKKNIVIVIIVVVSGGDGGIYCKTQSYNNNKMLIIIFYLTMQTSANGVCQQCKLYK